MLVYHFLPISGENPTEGFLFFHGNLVKQKFMSRRMGNSHCSDFRPFRTRRKSQKSEEAELHPALPPFLRITSLSSDHVHLVRRAEHNGAHPRLHSRVSGARVPARLLPQHVSLLDYTFLYFIHVKWESPGFAHPARTTGLSWPAAGSNSKWRPC